MYCTVLIDLFIIIIRNRVARLNYMIDCTVYFRTALSILFTVTFNQLICGSIVLVHVSCTRSQSQSKACMDY